MVGCLIYPHLLRSYDFSTKRIQSLQPTEIRGVGAGLENMGSYLIICAAPGSHPHEDIVRDFGVRLEPPPVSTSILLERHLAYYGGEEIALGDIQAFLRKPELNSIVRQPLSPQGADDLSKRLICVLRGQMPLEEALTGHRTALESQVEAWFDEAGDDVEERSFRIALAAFDGARYSSVRAAAQTLAERIKPALPEDPEQPPPTPPSPFAGRRRDRLKRACAHLELVPEPGSELPGSRIEVVRLDNQEYAPTLLSYLWSEYDVVRDDLLDWLSFYAVNHTADMRNRAAAAIGVLATQDFTTIRDKVLISWINEQDRQYRAAIGKALGVLVWSEQHGSTVLALLEEWSERRDQSFRWAAARAYGDVGLFNARVAMAQWRNILISAEDEFDLVITGDRRLILDPRLFRSVLDTIINFFLAAIDLPERFRDIYEGAVEELKSWYDQDRKERKHHEGTARGLRIFAVLANVYVGQPGVESEPDTWPPAMLLVVDGRDPRSPYRMALAQLFRSALNWRPTQQDSLNALKRWLIRVDHDTRLEAQMTAVLRDIAFGEGATARDQGRLSAYLRRWSQHPCEPIKSAGRAREELFS